MELKQQYLNALNALDKDTAISLITNALDKKQVDLINVYQGLLSHALEDVDNKDHNIWEEHIKTQIVRTTIEAMYPYVLKLAPAQKTHKIAVITPEGELHELGGRIAADYLRILGFEVYYLGNSLPKHQLVDLVRDCHLDALAISISNFYTMSSLNTMIAMVNEANPELKIIIGGRAIIHNPSGPKGKNLLVCQTYEDLISATEAIKI
jgi:MerR family transcriptional regulator, light-induced transcriptional regulator